MQARVLIDLWCRLPMVGAIFVHWKDENRSRDWRREVRKGSRSNQLTAAYYDYYFYLYLYSLPFHSLALCLCAFISSFVVLVFVLVLVVVGLPLRPPRRRILRLKRKEWKWPSAFPSSVSASDSTCEPLLPAPSRPRELLTPKVFTPFDHDEPRCLPSPMESEIEPLIGAFFFSSTSASPSPNWSHPIQFHMSLLRMGASGRQWLQC